MRSIIFQFPQGDLKAGKHPAIVHDLDTGFSEADKCFLGVPFYSVISQGFCLLSYNWCDNMEHTDSLCMRVHVDQNGIV
jgi:hypothetical protein